jgi:hypothetical protein
MERNNDFYRLFSLTGEKISYYERGRLKNGRLLAISKNEALIAECNVSSIQPLYTSFHQALPVFWEYLSDINEYKNEV